MKVVTADEMRHIDETAIGEYGIPGVVLMENAGRSAADAVEAFLADSASKRVLIVAGRGNNGGDGFVVARHLVNGGIDCEICLAARKTDLKGDAAVNLAIAAAMGIPIVEVTRNIAPLEKAMVRADLIVDALLGTGLNKPVKGFYRGIIDAVNFSELPVISLDVPSGLDATTGRPLGAVIEADMTVTFGLPKIGTVIYPGADYAGDLVLADMGAPSELLEDEKIRTNLIREDDLKDILLPRLSDAHKGSFGHLLVVAGARGKSGAAVMTGQGAIRSGAGLVTVAGPAEIHSVLEMKLTEAMTAPLASNDAGELDSGAAAEIMALLENKQAVVIGPGLSRGGATGRVVREVVSRLKCAAVIDADALWHLADAMELIKEAPHPLILTPHPGEMARLLGKRSDEVQQDRINVARQFATGHGCYLVLKGARTLIATPEGELFINTTGNPGMATGGTGDVLCGIIGALLAQGYTLKESCLIGVYLHGMAGDAAAEERGEMGLIATDLIEKIPSLLMKFCN